MSQTQYDSIVSNLTAVNASLASGCVNYTAGVKQLVNVTRLMKNYTIIVRYSPDGTSSESIVFGWTYFGITASVGALA